MATQEIHDALAAHNAARHAAQGVKRPDLVWDERLAADAQKWATHLAENNLFQHEGMRGEGENLFMQMGISPPLPSIFISCKLDALRVGC